MKITDKIENRDKESTNPKRLFGWKDSKIKKQKNNKTNLWGNQPSKYSRINTQEIRNERGYTYTSKADYIK